VLKEFLIQDIVYHIPYRIWFGFSLFRFLIFMNAINRFDGVYGLASGVSTIGYLTVIILIQRVVIPNYPYIKPEDALLLETITNLSRILFIISFTYTVIEFKPLGLIRDAGTLFYGFTLAYLALLGGAKVWTFGVVFSLVIFDAIRVSINRIFVQKKSPFKGDYTHLHHRLLANGRTRGEIRAFVWIRTSFLMILMILQSVDRISKIIIFLCMALIFFWVHIYLFRIKKLPNEFKMRK
jgi:UDP-GlcNAc:undecaprenyl-phosphate GlcNAc-1-phosphate transferase